jgi:RND family efflux transporter MFP subunit
VKQILLFISAALLLSACSDIEPGRSNGDAPQVSGLTVQVVGTSQLAAIQSYVGTVESPDRAQLAARIDGRVSRVAVREGDRVAAGTLLLTIEGNVAGDRLSESEGMRQAAAARLRLAERTHARYQQLRAAEAVTPQELDRVEAELEQAREGLKTAEAAVGQARTAVAMTQIKAPFAARVVRREVEVGSTVLPGSPLLVLDRLGGWQVRIDVPEAEAGGFAVGDLLSVEIPSSGQNFSGKVAEIQPAADTGSRSFRVKVDLPSNAPVSSGLFARVGRTAETSATLLVPQSAIVERGQLTGLYVVEQGVLRFRLVKIGRKVGDRVEILSGLNPGESVVTAGAERARSGARVGG